MAILKKQLLVFLTVFLCISCDNQYFKVFGYALKNFITAPIGLVKGVANFVTGNTYDNLKKKSQNYQEKKEGDELVLVCKNGKEQRILLGDGSILHDLRDIKDHLVAQYCSCKVWGTCTEELCPCDRLCPWSFELFKKGDVENLRDYNKTEHTLAFRNVPSAFVNQVDRENFFGFCNGFPPLISKFNRLAFFKEKESPPYDITSNDENEVKMAIEYYKKIIEDIYNNKVREIPGFANLHELSEVPALQLIFKQKVEQEWGNINMRANRLGLWIDQVTPGIKQKIDANISDIKERVDNFMQPSVYIKTDQALHEVLVSHYIEDEKGNITFCTQNPNNFPNDSRECDNQLSQQKDGSLMLEKHGKISYLGVSDVEDSNVVEQINSLWTYCKKKKCKEEKVDLLNSRTSYIIIKN